MKFLHVLQNIAYDIVRYAMCIKGYINVLLNCVPAKKTASEHVIITSPCNNIMPEGFYIGTETTVTLVDTSAHTSPLL